jgi:hypothetical protein
MHLSLKPFNGIRIHPNPQLNSDSNTYAILENNSSQLHPEALPALYLYLEKEKTGKLNYIGLIGIIIENKVPIENRPFPAIWTSESIAPQLPDILKPWIEHPEVEIASETGHILQLSVIQSFQTIQDILGLVNKCNWTCLDSTQLTHPLVCLSLKSDSPKFSHFPFGLLSLPTDYAENSSPFNISF